MLNFRNLVLFGSVLSLFVLTGCGGQIDSPEQSAAYFFNALARENYDSAYEMLTTSQREKIEKELQQLAEAEGNEALAKLNAQFGTAFTQDEIGGMAGENFFSRALKEARKSDAKLREMLEKPPVILDSRFEDSGEQVARVRVRFGAAQGEGETKSFRFFLEDGEWRPQFNN